MSFSRKKKVLLWSLGGLLLLLVIAVVVVPIEYARRHWEKTQQDLRARGEGLFAGDFPQAAVADAENYFKMPLFQEKALSKRLSELSDAITKLRNERAIGASEQAYKVGQPWDLAAVSKGADADATAEEKRQETIRWLESKLAPFEELREELISGGRRPFSSMGFNLAEGYFQVSGIGIPMIQIALYLRLHATLALEQKNSKAAMSDLQCLVRGTYAYAGEPTNMHLAAARALWHLILLSIRQGMEVWSDEELVQLEGILARSPVGKQRFAETLRLERATANSIIQETMTKGDPHKLLLGDSPRELFWLYRLYLPLPWANFNLEMQSLIDLAESDSATLADYEALEHISRSRAGVERFSNSFGDLTIPVLAEIGPKTIRCSDETLLTRVALVLELFRRKHGQYPENLGQLVPANLIEIPVPTLPGQRIQYHRNDKGGYRIWTPGWNGTDEGGAPESSKGREGDWSLHGGPQDP